MPYFECFETNVQGTLNIIELCEKIQERAGELFSEFDHNRMRLSQLGNRNQ